MKKIGTIILLQLVLSWGPTLQAVWGGDAGQSRFDHFITRQGNQLFDGDKPFRFVGANMPGIMLPYDFTLYLPERMNLPTPWEQEDAFKTLDQMNLRVLRTWNLPIRGPKEERKPWHYVLGPGQFNEDAFKVTDSMLALANKYGVRVIFNFTAEFGDYLGGIGTYADYRGKRREEFFTDPQVREDYKATVRYVLTRTNTLTGLPYRDDKAILAWQFGNEMPTAPDAWLREMAAYIKGIDTNHLVAETRHQPGTTMAIDPNIDLVTRHLYTSYSGTEDGWPATLRRELATLKSQRPLFIGEFGPYINGTNFTHANVVEKLHEFLTFVEAEQDIAGALLWSMYFRHQDGGFYWHQIMTFPAAWSYHWPGFPSADAQCEIGLMRTMREAAFKIQGKPVPQLPVPAAPELLNFTGVPMFSWRGSVGASGYDIERASKADGSWAVIATNVSDADIAYRPLYSDDTVSSGQTWFYQIIARNESGVSKPSNVVGPVRVKRACFVDELQDFSRVRAKSDGLVLNNDYNALYAEYLFRANGKSGDWIIYQVAGDIESVKATTFFDKNLADFSVQASADGRTFSPIKLNRLERCLPAPPGGAANGRRRTLVEYQGSFPAGNHYLKILWNGAAELDRVEIYHSGAAPGSSAGPHN